MIRIAICDDDAEVVEIIKQYLLQKEKQLPDEQLDISVFNTGEDFLKDIDCGALFHIAFMDIKIDGIDGIEVGQTLRNQTESDETILIYVSSHNSHSRALLGIGAYRFISKPICKDELDSVFSRALGQTIKNGADISKKKAFNYKVHRDTHSIMVDSIVYVRSTKKTIEIYIWNKSQETITLLEKFYSNILDVKEQLAYEAFTQCSRTHIVNLDHVERLDGNNFIFSDTDKTAIQISRKYSENAKKAYFNYRKNMNG